MKRLLMVLFMSVLLLDGSTLYAQTNEAIQLGLNIQKLNQLRKILKNMYDSYKIVSSGYNRIKDIANGNYKLHQVFLDGLYTVNPNIRNYKRVADIINLQTSILKEYKTSLARFKSSKFFKPEEIEYITSVYAQLTDESLQNITELTMVLTGGKLRMSDDERLQAIDRIYKQMQEKLSFLQYFNNNTSILELQRKKEFNDIQTMREINGIKK